MRDGRGTGGRDKAERAARTAIAIMGRRRVDAGAGVSWNDHLPTEQNMLFDGFRASAYGRETPVALFGLSDGGFGGQALLSDFLSRPRGSHASLRGRREAAA